MRKKGKKKKREGKTPNKETEQVEAKKGGETREN